MSAAPVPADESAQLAIIGRTLFTMGDENPAALREYLAPLDDWGRAKAAEAIAIANREMAGFDAEQDDLRSGRASLSEVLDTMATRLRAGQLNLAEVDPDELSGAERTALLDRAARIEWLASLPPEQVRALPWDWNFWGRPTQLWPRPDEAGDAGDWRFLLIRAGRGAGKALALDTPLPTPTGWTTMGEVRQGDLLLGADGRPCEVLAAHDVLIGRACSRVVFSDGSSVVCDDEHLWETSTHAARKALYRAATPRIHPQVRTTAEIRRTLTQGSRSDRNHSVRVAAPLKLPEADLLVDPYVLGFWLGDGSSAYAEVTIGDEDAREILPLLAAAGEPVTGPPRRSAGAHCMTYPIGGVGNSRDPATGRMIANSSLNSRLKRLGVIKNKHVPDAYRRASEDQRRALLAGLLDSDGSVGGGPRQRVEFCSTKGRLAQDVYELVVSLGMRATMAESDAKIYGRVVGRRWRLTFRPMQQVFGLPRKAALLTFGQKQTARQTHRMVVAVDPVPSVPVRCVTVDASDSLYLCGRSMIPTHNTRTGAELTRQRAKDPTSMVFIGATPADVRDLMIEGDSGILAITPPGERPMYEPSKRLLTWPNGTIAYIRSAADPDDVRGLNVSWAWLDELAKWRYLAETWSNLRFAMRKGDNPQTVVTTTPKPLQLLRDLSNHRFRGTVVRTESTYRNAAHLAPAALEEYREVYEGTRLGAQELHAEILEEAEGALWSFEMIEADRLLGYLEDGEWVKPPLPEFRRRIVAVDPSLASTGGECGIIVAALGLNGHGYILDDRSLRAKPSVWAEAVMAAYRDWDADALVVETNLPGREAVEDVLKALPDYHRVRFIEVKAHVGKDARAEPVVGRYEKHLVHHVGTFAELEMQLCNWVPGGGQPSPDRLDALVWAITELLVRFGGPTRVRIPDRPVVKPPIIRRGPSSSRVVMPSRLR